MNNDKSIKKRLASNTIAFRITAGQDIGITRKTVQTLGNPSFLQFWWSDNEKTLLISAGKEETPESVPVPDYFYHFTNGQKIKNQKLRKKLEVTLEMKNGETIRMHGTYDPQLEMVAFPLNRAEKEVLCHE